MKYFKINNIKIIKINKIISKIKFKRITIKS
jgi:hypothetical protein